MVYSLRRAVGAGGLVLYPLFFLAYFALTPAYGLLDASKIARAFEGHATTGTIATAIGLAGCVLAMAATLALMRLLMKRSPRLALIGGAVSLIGWMSLVGALTPEIVAEQLSAGGWNDASVAFFDRLSNSPLILAFNVLALCHIIGAVILGSALWRTRAVPLWAGMLATFVKVVHFIANVSGLFWLDASMWVLLAVAYATVARAVLRDDAA